MARKRVVILGGGFAGYHAAKSLLTSSAAGQVDVVLVNPTDYFLYLPLLPEVAAGILDPRRLTVSLPAKLPGAELVLGAATSVDLASRTVRYRDPEAREGTLDYDRLVFAAGSVNKLLPIPGVATHAHGFRGLPEALYARDHITRQVELAAMSSDVDEQAARCTFVVVGAGYTGTELAAQGPGFTGALTARHRKLTGRRARWLLLDVADRVLPQLDVRLGRTAEKVLRERGVEVRTGTSVQEATADGVRLSDGEFVPSRSLFWCVGVSPDPLITGLGVPTEQGRIVVDTSLSVPEHPGVFVCGDAAAVPDETRPGELTGMTAQHAQRQGTLAGRNVAASLGYGRQGRYRHRDLGFLVDLGARRAAANPLHVPLSGLPAKVVTRGYHLLAMPGNRVRTAGEWLQDAVLGRQTVQLGLVRSGSVPLDSASPETARTHRETPRANE